MQTYFLVCVKCVKIEISKEKYKVLHQKSFYLYFLYISNTQDYVCFKLCFNSADPFFNNLQEYYLK